MNPPLQLAPQLSEKTFRVYEPFIARAVKAWPEETQYPREEMVNQGTGRTLSPNTFAARMRDSVVSFQRFGWESYIDREKFTTIFGQFAVACSIDGSVWFRNRGRKGRPLSFAKEGQASEGTVRAQGMATVWQGVGPAEVAAAVVLLHHGRITGPIVFPGKLEVDVAQFEAAYNVAFFYDEANNQTVLT